MGLLEAALVSMCISAGGSDSQQLACQKATEAGAKQSGIAERTVKIEKKAVKKLEKQAKEDLGEAGSQAVAGGLYLAKVISSRSLTIGLPTFGMCHSFKTEIKPETSMLVLEWKF